MINFCNVLNSSSSVRVHAHWEPIADATFNMHNDSPQLAEMFDLSPCNPIKEYEVADFKVFLPPSTVAVGDVWALDPNSIVPFLYQFHPGATADLGNGAEGAYACLRACSSDYAEITFRIHAEFTLGSNAHQEPQQENAEEEGERESEAKFIPSQYVGQVLVNLKKGRAIQLYLFTLCMWIFSTCRSELCSRFSLRMFTYIQQNQDPNRELNGPGKRERFARFRWHSLHAIAMLTSTPVVVQIWSLCRVWNSSPRMKPTEMQLCGRLLSRQKKHAVH